MTIALINPRKSQMSRRTIGLAAALTITLVACGKPDDARMR